MTSDPGIEPEPHWWKASALTTAPTLLPNFYYLVLKERFRFGRITNELKVLISSHSTDDYECDYEWDYECEFIRYL